MKGLFEFEKKKFEKKKWLPKEKKKHQIFYAFDSNLFTYLLYYNFF